MQTYGVTFPSTSQWHTHQQELINSLKRQIEAQFNGENVLVNMTWFGPQFENNTEYAKFLAHGPIDNLFLLASEDPCFFNQQETDEFIATSGAKHTYLLGHFDTKYHFNFFSTVIGNYFPHYTDGDLLMDTPRYVFLNYNRKPRAHRTKFVKMLDERKLSNLGIVTLGNDRTLGETIEEYEDGNWNMPDDYGIPHDIHSLGRPEYWQNHFLNVVGETDFEDHLWTYITEKTYKPIIGLRPFVINGQQAVYTKLREQGFRTFNNYWPHIDIEECNIDDIHKNICNLIEWLKTQDLKQIYVDMLPDLRYNKKRFNEFAIEQKHRMENLFA